MRTHQRWSWRIGLAFVCAGLIGALWAYPLPGDNFVTVLPLPFGRDFYLSRDRVGIAVSIPDKLPRRQPQPPKPKPSTRAVTVLPDSLGSESIIAVPLVARVDVLVVESPADLRSVVSMLFAMEDLPWYGLWSEAGESRHAGRFDLIASKWWPTALILFGFFPLVFRTRHVWVIARRRRLNLCLVCGYPLFGPPEPRCPECGSIAQVDAARTAIAATRPGNTA